MGRPRDAKHRVLPPKKECDLWVAAFYPEWALRRAAATIRLVFRDRLQPLKYGFQFSHRSFASATPESLA